MASESGRGDSRLEDLLHEQPYRFRFFQAVRLLRMLLRARGRSAVQGVVERIRFRTPLSLEFPASEIQALRTKLRPGGEDDDQTLEMVVNFMGLTGPQGVLPSHYTETLISAQIQHRDSLRDDDLPSHRFLDIFSHRAISLFARAWDKYRFWIAYEQGDRGSLTRNLLDLAGLGTDRLRGRLRDRHSDGLRDEAIAYYAGLLSQRPYSASAIAALISDYFGAKAVIESFRGRWLRLPADCQTRLGRQNSVLGETAVLGSAAWDHQSALRVRLGPLDPRTFEDLLPGGSGHEALKRLVKFCTGVSHDTDVQLVLTREKVPACRLGATPGSPRLGLTTWLGTPDPGDPAKLKFTRDADDVVLAI